MVGHNSGTNRLDFKPHWLKVKVTRGQKVKIVLPITPFKIVAESRDKITTYLIQFSEDFSRDYYGRRTDIFKDR